MDWWIGLRVIDNPEVIIPMRFRTEASAEEEFSRMRQGARARKKQGGESSEICPPIQADTEKEAVERIRVFMGW